VSTDLRARLIETFRWYDPGPGSTHLVSDISGWWRDGRILGEIGPALAGLHSDAAPTAVVAPEVTGFILGPLVARALGVGFVEAYKDTRDQRLTDAVAWGRTAPDYRGRRLSLGVRRARVGPGDRVLLVDDWAATGAQLGALHEALASVGATVLGAAVVVDARPGPAGTAGSDRATGPASHAVGSDRPTGPGGPPWEVRALLRAEELPA